MQEIDFIELSKEKIVRVVRVEEKDDYVFTTLVIEQYRQLKQRPYKFRKDKWQKVKERGYV